MKRSPGDRRECSARNLSLDQLERRQLLSTPSSPRPETLSWFDRGERAELVSRLTNMNSTRLAQLSGKLPSSGSAFGAFDSDLLSYMTSRTTASWFFDDSETSTYASFIASKIDMTNINSLASSVVSSRNFPETGSSETYSVSVPGNINWATPGGSSDPNFVHTLNRFEFWRPLVESYRVSGNTAAADEIMYQLADWSDEFRTIDAPSGWSSGDKTGWILDTAIRADSMVNAYFTLLGSAAFSERDNVLFLHKLMQHGDWLLVEANKSATTFGTGNNRTLTLARGLHQLGVMFPEFDNAPTWESTARNLMFAAAQAQVYPDGSHIEQSPNYSEGVIESLLIARRLDLLNGNGGAWSGAMITRIDNAFESFRQLLAPDGRAPGIGDTYRQYSVTNFLRAGLILEKIEVKQSTIVGNWGTGATSFTVADATRFAVGDVVNASNKSELMRVTGVNTGTNTLTVTKAIAGTSARSLDAGTTLYNLGQHPIAKPRIRDVWLFGPDTTLPFMNVPATPAGALGDRGLSYAMTDSGNFVLRSDNSENATQLIFDSGAKGGFHGHHDPLSFELFGGGRPLVIDPGPYKYDESSDRAYAISTRAHNTINVDGENTGNYEDPDGTGPRVTPNVGHSYSFSGSGSRVTGWHQNYSHIPGRPVVARSVWYDHAGTFVIVDWVDGARSRSYQQSFNLPATVEANTTGVSANNDFRTRYTTGKNVQIRALSGGTVARGGMTWVTGEPEGTYKSDAYRFTVTKSGTFAMFATLVQVYDGLTAPTVTASVSGGTSITQAVNVTLGGSVFASINLAPPTFERVGSNGTVNGTFNDVELDSSGNLHMVYLDRTDRKLKYTSRDAVTNNWSAIQVVDDAAPNVGQFLDMKLDNNGRPAVAYFDGTNGDLKYAILRSDTNAWEVQTVESRGSVGLYPALAFTRSSNSALISYYHRTNKDLKVATQQTETTWSIETFTGATAGDQGRFSRIMIDPNRTDLNGRYVVAWEDTTSARYKYAYNDGGWKIETIPDAMTSAGGYLSLAFEDSGSGTTNQAGANNFRMLPRVSYYESQPDTSLKFASRSKTGTWTVSRIDGEGTSRRTGLYTNLFYNSQGRPEIFYFDIRNNLARRAVNTGGSNWTLSTLATGGRELQLARRGASLIFTSLNEPSQTLSVIQL